MRRTMLLAALAAIFFPAVSFAQANRGSTTSGAFGSTTLGSTSGASPSGLGSGMTQGMSSGSTQGGSGAGAGVGGTTSQMMQGGGPAQLQRGGNTGFVGLSSNTVQNPFSTGQRGGGNQNFNQLTQLMTRSRQNQFNAQQAQKAGRVTTQAQSQFRVPLRLGFQPAAISTGISPMPRLERGLAKVPELRNGGQINVSLEAGTTAILRGRVATEADRQLAEGLARLEPGVTAVRNELVVGPAAATEAALPSPASSTP